MIWKPNLITFNSTIFKPRRKSLFHFTFKWVWRLSIYCVESIYFMNFEVKGPRANVMGNFFLVKFLNFWSFVVQILPIKSYHWYKSCLWWLNSENKFDYHLLIMLWIWSSNILYLWICFRLLVGWRKNIQFYYSFLTTFIKILCTLSIINTVVHDIFSGVPMDIFVVKQHL